MCLPPVVVSAGFLTKCCSSGTSPGCGSKEVRKREPIRNQECPRRSHLLDRTRELFMQVIIGIDPHKNTHTAVAIDSTETEVGSLQVRATKSQTRQLLDWAAGFEQRTWAVEGAGGWGYLLSQQLLAAGET